VIFCTHCAIASKRVCMHSVMNALCNVCIQIITFYLLWLWADRKWTTLRDQIQSMIMLNRIVIWGHNTYNQTTLLSLYSNILIFFLYKRPCYMKYDREWHVYCKFQTRNQKMHAIPVSCGCKLEMELLIQSRRLIVSYIYYG